MFLMIFTALNAYMNDANRIRTFSELSDTFLPNCEHFNSLTENDNILHILHQMIDLQHGESSILKLFSNQNL